MVHRIVSLVVCLSVILGAPQLGFAKGDFEGDFNVVVNATHDPCNILQDRTIEYQIHSKLISENQFGVGFYTADFSTSFPFTESEEIIKQLLNNSTKAKSIGIRYNTRSIVVKQGNRKARSYVKLQRVADNPRTVRVRQAMRVFTDGSKKSCPVWLSGFATQNTAPSTHNDQSFIGNYDVSISMLHDSCGSAPPGQGSGTLDVKGHGPGNRVRAQISTPIMGVYHYRLRGTAGPDILRTEHSFPMFNGQVTDKIELVMVRNADQSYSVATTWNMYRKRPAGFELCITEYVGVATKR